MDDRFQPQLSVRSAYLRKIHSCQPSNCENRHSLSERRPGKRLREGAEGCARSEGKHDRRGGVLRTVRSDSRLANGDAEIFRRDLFYNITTPKFGAQAI